MGWKEYNGWMEYIEYDVGIKGGGWNRVGKYSGIYGKPYGGRVKSRGCVGGIHWDV